MTAMTQDLYLGPLENRLLMGLSSRGVSVFTIGDAREVLQATGPSVRRVLMNLTRKRRLQRIERGKYLLVPERAGPELYWSEYPWPVVSHLVDRYYVGFSTAMEYWGMTEQIPYTVFVATTREKRNLEFGHQRYEFLTLAEKKFFGFVEEKAGGRETFNISSREKTIVDGLMHPEYCGGMVEVVKAMWRARDELDWDGVLEAAGRTGIRAVLKRLGYLLDVLGIQEGLARSIAGEVKRYPYQYLDPSVEKDNLGRSREYGLVLNRDRDELLGWVGH